MSSRIFYKVIVICHVTPCDSLCIQFHLKKFYSDNELITIDPMRWCGNSVTRERDFGNCFANLLAVFDGSVEDPTSPWAAWVKEMKDQQVVKELEVI